MLYIILFSTIRLINPIMLNFIPTFCVYMILKLWFILITAHSYDSQFFAPFCLFFFKHFLIVSHWFLTWIAIRCPKFYKPNLSLFMLKIYRSFLLKRTHIIYCFVLTTSTNLGGNAHLNMFKILDNIFYFFIEFVNILLEF